MSWRWVAFYRCRLYCLSDLERKGGRHVGLFIAGFEVVVDVEGWRLRDLPSFLCSTSSQDGPVSTIYNAKTSTSKGSNHPLEDREKKCCFM